MARADHALPWRYLLNGLLATLVHYVALVLAMEWLELPLAALANLLAAALGIAVAFFGARHFVYRRSAEPLLRQWLRFNLLYISAALLHGLVLYLWSDLAGLDYRLGFLLATLLQVVISYWGNKRLVFA